MGDYKRNVQLDWLTIFSYLALVFIGWINIYSASLSESSQGFFDFNQIYFKQLVFIVTSLGLIIFILALDSKFY